MPTSPADLALGLLHVEAAGAGDDVGAADRLGAVGQRGDRLGAAHAVDLVDAAQRAGGEDHRVGAGRADDDLLDPGHARGDDAHDDRARVRVAAAGDVDRGAAHRHLAQEHAVALGQLRPRRRRRGRRGHGAARSRSRPPGRRARRGRGPRPPRRAPAGATRSGRPSTRVEALDVARAAPRRRRSRTAATIAATVAVDRRGGGDERTDRRGQRPRVGGARQRRRSTPTQALQHAVDRRRLAACARPGWRSGARSPTAISSRTTSPFSRSVVPVAVRSTIASHSPVSGASSTEPLTSTISAWRPVRSK